MGRRAEVQMLPRQASHRTTPAWLSIIAITIALFAGGAGYRAMFGPFEEPLESALERARRDPELNAIRNIAGDVQHWAMKAVEALEAIARRDDEAGVDATNYLGHIGARATKALAEHKDDSHRQQAAERIRNELQRHK